MPREVNRFQAKALGRVALVLACSAMAAAAQTPGASTLPASAPTSGISASQLPSANPAVPSTPDTAHSEIAWDGNTLQVITANTSLNRLLQEIARKTNLQITGSAPEEKTFGTYGPGKLEDVLSDLLDGLAVNMLFVDRPGTETKQLVLTSRSGGPSLPTQNMPSATPDVARSAPSQFPSQNGPSQNDRPPFIPPPPVDNPSAGGEAPASGSRTPQQIFEQLQRLRQQANAPK